MNEQKIRAKSLEIAALILGERYKLETYKPPSKPVDTYNPPKAVMMINYDATLAHYVHLADAIAAYIQ